MLTLLLSLTTPAEAADSYRMETVYKGGLDFKTCADQSDDTWYWWYMVDYNATSGLGPSGRSVNSCFDIDAVTSDSEGQKWLDGMAEDYAKKNGAYFSRPTSTSEQVVLSSETVDYISYTTDWVFVGGGMIDIYKDGMFLATFETMGIPVEHISVTDVDNNGINDILVKMANDEIWHAKNVNLGDVVFHTGQGISYNF